MQYCCKDLWPVYWKLWQWFLFSESIICVGDWQIQIIFTQRNQYHAQIFVYVWHRLHAHYMHSCKSACNLSRPDDPSIYKGSGVPTVTYIWFHLPSFSIVSSMNPIMVDM